MVQIPSPQDAESLEIIEFQGFPVFRREPVKTHKQTHFTNFLPTLLDLPPIGVPSPQRFDLPCPFYYVTGVVLCGSSLCAFVALCHTRFFFRFFRKPYFSQILIRQSKL